ncbi:hypothetical protein DV735_g5461, partial [Chaetothyriales sp. CBS 134920]
MAAATEYILHGDPISGNVYKVLLTASLLSIPIEYRKYATLRGETRTPAFLSTVSSFGRIPSNAICYYLADTAAVASSTKATTSLIPSDPILRANMLAWMFFEQNQHEVNIATLRFWLLFLGEDNLSEAQKAQIATKREFGAQALSYMNDELEKKSFSGGWLVGDSVTLADICLFAYTHRAHEAGFDLSRWPAIQAWLRRVTELESWTGQPKALRGANPAISAAACERNKLYIPARRSPDEFDVYKRRPAASSHGSAPQWKASSSFKAQDACDQGPFAVHFNQTLAQRQVGADVPQDASSPGSSSRRPHEAIHPSRLQKPAAAAVDLHMVTTTTPKLVYEPPRGYTKDGIPRSLCVGEKGHWTEVHHNSTPRPSRVAARRRLSDVIISDTSLDDLTRALASFTLDADTPKGRPADPAKDKVGHKSSLPSGQNTPHTRLLRPGHELDGLEQQMIADVRAVLHPDPSFAVTASRDGSTKVWKQLSTAPPKFEASESSHGAQFKTCLAYAPPSKEYPDGLVVSSGQDALIEARQPTTIASDNADGFMVGHQSQVSTLDVGGEGRWIVSGSWDTTAKIWQVGRWEPDVELPGHTASVWAVVAYDDDRIITGSADRGIRIFDLRGKLVTSFDGKDVVRALVKLPKGHASGADFASASNDGAVRLWTLKGDLVAELWGHENFIYSLTVLPSGEIVSSGEDRSVRVWQGSECVQVLTLPAISVWSVSACPNGDIIVGSSDKTARIFTRDKERVADDETLRAFEDEMKSSAIPQAQIGGLNIAELKDYDWLQGRRGTKEGQQQIVKKDGQPTLYTWSAQQQTWVEVGQVVDAAGGESKTTYDGKQYDYVFDIDIEDGKPPLKLPYNVTQNPYEAATKFLQNNELPLTYLEETANFIIKNSQGATLGQQSGPAPSHDAWGTENRYRPGEQASSSYQPPAARSEAKLPQTSYLSIVLGKPTAAAEQIAKRNAEYKDTDAALSPAQLEILSTIAEQLSTYNFQGKPSYTGPPELSILLPSLVQSATQWQPPANRLAVLDLLRFLAAALRTIPSSDRDDDVDLVAAVLGSGIFDPDQLTANSKLVMLALRLFANLLYGNGKELVETHIDEIIESLKPIVALASSDVNVAIAYTTTALNLAVLITAPGTKTDPDISAHRGLSLVEELSKFVAGLPSVDHKPSASANQQSTEPAYRALVALGTLIVGLRRDEVREAARSVFEIPKLLTGLKSKKYLDEPRFQAVVAELKAAL